MIQKQKYSNDDLQAAWWYRTKEDELKKIKTYTAVCSCGNNRLILAASIVRCEQCGKGYSYEHFINIKSRCERLARLEGGHRGRIKQWLPQTSISSETVLIDVKTGLVQKIKLSKQYVDIIKKSINIETTCGACKKIYKYTGEHRLAGYLCPMIVINNQEMCYSCAKKLLLSE